MSAGKWFMLFPGTLFLTVSSFLNSIKFISLFLRSEKQATL